LQEVGYGPCGRMLVFQGVLGLYVELVRCLCGNLQCFHNKPSQHIALAPSSRV
jgi:hypothetical protein